MALGKCPECDAEVSTVAEKCKSCGFGIEAHFTAKYVEEQRVSQFEVNAPPPQSSSKPKWVWVFVIVAIAVVAWLYLK